jgi:DNA polymerase-3 subunit gamma/tau
MSLALARKYRPRSFADVVGQEHVVRALSNALDTGRLHHAYLFTGTRGVGKTTLARIVAKCLNCETGVTSTPCGVCGACREIDTGRFIDLLELDAASNTQVDNMRELLENALYAPTAGRFKVYIIDEVHMLSRNAFNAMLKTLEEPPAHVKFILATTDAHRVPVTVLSRCLQFSLKQMPPAVVRERLEAVLAQESVAFDGAATALLARAASGSLRDGLSLLDQAIAHGGGRVDESAVRGMLGAVDATWLFDLLERLVAADGPGLMDLAGGLESRGLSFETALADLAALLQRLAVAQAVPSAIADDEPERARLLSLAGRLSPEDVQLHYQIALRGRADLPLAPDEFGGFTMTLLRMLAFAPVPPEGDGRRAALPARGGSGASHGPAAAGRGAAAAAPASAPQAAPAPSAPPPAEPSGGGLAVAVAAPIEAASWPDVVASLRPGQARMLGEQAVVVSSAPGHLVLAVPESARHLSDAAWRDKLRASLEERYGSLRIDVRVDPAAQGETLAARETREREQLQQQARSAIESDPFVRELVEQFDGRVVEGSIRPVEGSRSQSQKGSP